MGRAEIDTGAPFRSVKEAVTLFGEKILVGEIYGGKLGEKHEGESDDEKTKPRLQTLEAELEEAKESLKKATEENDALSQLRNALAEELETTKKELSRLTSRAFLKQHENPDVEDLKFIEKPRDKLALTKIKTTGFDQEEEEECFEKKRFVKFASPTSLARVMASREGLTAGQKHHRLAVAKTTKMKPVVPLIGWLFARNKV